MRGLLGRKDVAYPIAGLLACSLVFIYAETVQPFTFLADDNYTQFLPALLEGIRQLLSGSIPYINMHQLAGSPLLSVGTYPVFYPPTLISYFFAKYALGSELYLIDVFVVSHALLGFLATYFLLRRMRVDPLCSTLGAMSACVSGAFMIFSANWFHVSPAIFFLPVLLWLADVNASSPSKKNALLSGIVRGIYFFSGNLQFFIYTCFFEALFLLARTWPAADINAGNREGARKTATKNNGFFGGVAGNLNSFANSYWQDERRRAVLVNYALSLLISAAIALPLALAMLGQLSGSWRGGVRGAYYYLAGTSANPTDLLLGGVLPYPLYTSAFSPPGFPYNFANVYYSNTVLFAAALWGMWHFGKKTGRRLLRDYPFASLFLAAAVLSLGTFGVAYGLMILVPVWNKLFAPFKLLLYADFFVACFGAQMLSVLFAKVKGKRAATLARAGVCAALLLLILASAHYSVQACIICPRERGMPQPGAFSSFMDSRIVSYSTNSYYALALQNPNFAPFGTLSISAFMGRNFPSMYGLYSIGGYEPLRTISQLVSIPLESDDIFNKNFSTSWLSSWGVKYAFVPCDSLKYHPELWSFGLDRRFESYGLWVLDNPSAKSIVTCDGEGGAVDFSWEADGLSIRSTSSLPRNCTAAVLYDKNYAFYVNGAREQVYSDALGAVSFSLPAGISEAELRYENSSFLLGIAFAFLLLAAIAVFFKQLGTALDNFFSLIVRRKLFALLMLSLLVLFVFFLVRDLSDVPFAKVFSCAVFEGTMDSKAACIATAFDSFRISSIRAESSAGVYSLLNLQRPQGFSGPPDCAKEYAALSRYVSGT